jgi:hypothetical protein
MAIEMKSISNYDYLRYMTTASREISDEPFFMWKGHIFCTVIVPRGIFPILLSKVVDDGKYGKIWEKMVEENAYIIGYFNVQLLYGYINY